MKLSQFKREYPLYIMLIPCVIIVLIYSYGPLMGSVIAFQKFVPAKGIWGSKFVGLDNFRFVFGMPGALTSIRNTLVIAFFKIIGGVIAPITFALLLNEIRRSGVKRSFQTIVYLPNFLSWVILGGLLFDLLSPSTGPVNRVLSAIGIEPIFFLGDKFWFPITVVITDIWKEFGFGTVVYLAALTNIDPTLYEAAITDGASRWKQTIHVTIPGIMPIIILMSVLGMGNILNAGFDQIFMLYSKQVYETGDIIDTFVYRIGIEQAQYSWATAVGLFKSVISLVFVSLSYFMADRFANYQIF